jgi:hypothetical protein
MRGSQGVQHAVTECDHGGRFAVEQRVGAMASAGYDEQFTLDASLAEPVGVLEAFGVEQVEVADADPGGG